jgi:FKBP-type peptidyl-prolyl cis-trans isomerase FkpA
MRNMYKWLIVLVVCAFVFACNSSIEETDERPKEIEWSKDQSTQFGESLAREDEIGIRLYLKQRPEWEMKESGTGLRYWIYEQTEGRSVNKEDVVRVEFKVELLDGTLCYATEKEEYSLFKVDKSDVETGVQEGIKYMREGERAKLIIPSHLGHGLIGDLDKIPPMQVLIVDLHVKSIE